MRASKENNKADEVNECYQCNYWQYTDSIVRKYGEGTGYCDKINEPTGCNRKACLIFEKNTEI